MAMDFKLIRAKLHVEPWPVYEKRRHLFIIDVEVLFERDGLRFWEYIADAPVRVEAQPETKTTATIKLFEGKTDYWGRVEFDWTPPSSGVWIIKVYVGDHLVMAKRIYVFSEEALYKGVEKIPAPEEVLKPPPHLPKFRPFERAKWIQTGEEVIVIRYLDVENMYECLTSQGLKKIPPHQLEKIS